eukprot:g96.t1
MRAAAAADDEAEEFRRLRLLYGRRTSKRDRKGRHMLQRRDVKDLLAALRSSSKSVPVVLRLKNYVASDINTIVVDAILDALEHNAYVEALYIQNFEEGMLDDQLIHLSRILERGQIWCLNVGENFKITRRGWETFAKALPRTNVTHLYVSEHNIPSMLKSEMMDAIRENRRYDRRHRDFARIEWINKIGQMWWNPRLKVNPVLARYVEGCRGCGTSFSIPSDDDEDVVISCKFSHRCTVAYHKRCLPFRSLVDDSGRTWICDLHRDILARASHVPLDKSMLYESSTECASFMRKRKDFCGRRIYMCDSREVGRILCCKKLLRPLAGGKSCPQPSKWDVWFGKDDVERVTLLPESKYAVTTDIVWIRVLSPFDKEKKKKNKNDDFDNDIDLIWWPGMVFSHSKAASGSRAKEERGEKKVSLFNWADGSEWMNASTRYRPFRSNASIVESLRRDLFEENGTFNYHMMDDVNNLGVRDPQGAFSSKSEEWSRVYRAHTSEQPSSNVGRRAHARWVCALQEAYIELALMKALRNSNSIDMMCQSKRTPSRCSRCGSSLRESSSDAKAKFECVAQTCKIRDMEPLKMLSPKKTKRRKKANKKRTNGKDCSETKKEVEDKPDKKWALPPDWKITIHRRGTKGGTKTGFFKTYISPNNERFRSLAAVKKALSRDAVLSTSLKVSQESISSSENDRNDAESPALSITDVPNLCSLQRKLSTSSSMSSTSSVGDRFAMALSSITSTIRNAAGSLGKRLQRRVLAFFDDSSESVDGRVSLSERIRGVGVEDRCLMVCELKRIIMDAYGIPASEFDKFELLVNVDEMQPRRQSKSHGHHKVEYRTLYDFDELGTIFKKLDDEPKVVIRRMKRGPTRTFIKMDIRRETGKKNRTKSGRLPLCSLISPAKKRAKRQK